MAQFERAVSRAAMMSLVFLLAGCGGGDSDSDEGKFTVAGTLSGLANTTITLRLNNGLDLILGSNGPFHFSTKIEQGGSYAVTVQTQPALPSQTCTVTNGTGTISGDVSDVVVNCITNKYKVKGKLAGLNGGTVVIQNNAADDITLTANGDFEFATPVDSGAAVKVTVLTQPVTTPPQECTVKNGTVFMGAADITNVEVNCALKTFTIGGTLSGLAASSTLVLQNNAANNLSLTANGAFTFTTPIATGSTYAVTVLTAPATQQCTVTNGSGTVVDANITSVNVTCVNNSKITPSATIGGTVRGLDVAGLVLVNSGGEKLTVDSNGKFEFATALQRNTAYEVTVAGTPASPRHVCRVTNGRGTVGSNARVTNVDVTCEADRFAYVAHPGQITALVANHETGRLSPIAGTSTFATAPGATDIAADPRGRFIFVAHDGKDAAQHAISAFLVNPATGALTAVPGSPFRSATAVRELAVDSEGRFLYAADAGNVSGWAIRQDGSLAPAAGTAARASEFAATRAGKVTRISLAGGYTPCAVRQPPLSNTLFAVSATSAQLMLFGVDPASSRTEWRASEPLVSGRYCGSAGDPHGRFVYLPNSDDAADQLLGFSVGADGATLEPLALTVSSKANTYALPASGARAMVLRYNRRDSELLQVAE
jgi:hypothetical protein